MSLRFPDKRAPGARADPGPRYDYNDEDSCAGSRVSFCSGDALAPLARDTMTFTLRPYQSSDEDAAIALWQATWQQAYPEIDFAARVAWWRERWRSELVPKAAVIVAEQANELAGFVTIDHQGYLDQLVVSPSHWGSALATALVDEAKRRSPERITLLVNQDNARAIRFYERCGFLPKGEDVNPTSGRPVLKMEWRG